MAESFRVSVVDLDDKDTVDQLGSAIKEALAEQGKGKWVGTSSAWLGVKATEAIDDAIGGIDLFELFGMAWTNAAAIQERADPAKYPPDKPNYVKLGKHTINFDVRPKVMVSVGPWSSQPIEFVMALSAVINAMELKIRAGHIEAISGGKCDLGVSMKLGGKEVMKRKTLKSFELDAEHRFKEPGLSITVRKVPVAS
ncbi:MAG: hypothetical protein GW859_08970 [Sphingomonadales bacterium]|nr:hypothetical protein [Sphingomonadales bacterium]